MGLTERLQFVVENDFERLTYTEAINILRNSKPNKEKNSNTSSKVFGLTYNPNTNAIWWKKVQKARHSYRLKVLKHFICVE